MERWVIAVLAAACIGWGALLVAPIALLALTYGCTADDDRLAASLATLSILDAHPVGATPQEGRSSHCENDDRITTVQQAYLLSAPRADVLSFYREVAIKDGWTPPPNDDGEGLICFAKSVGGREVELSLGFSDAMREEHVDGYEVYVESSLDGGGWC
ncbi:hypothetical protein ACQP25_06820 [Microtetraspora malaysiensis]|uniref:hypothetical protein n=1 Tax=Microtetraspora malaysiensis TaxID=161358 RepID=UPI003D948A72